MADLQPPRKSVELEDSGTRDIDASEDDHFSDASEGKQAKSSAIPKTRIEKVDAAPRHGEVVGTVAHSMRALDAEPDELAVIPDEESNSGQETDSTTEPSKPSSPIPTTVLEKVEPEKRSHGEVPGTVAYETRKADAVPDVVTRAPAMAEADLEGVPTSPSNRYLSEEIQRPVLAEANSRQVEEHDERHHTQSTTPSEENEEFDGNEGFDDDFDDFERGNEGDDFGAFDDGSQAPPSPTGSESGMRPSTSPFVASMKVSLPVFDFEGLDSLQDLVAASQPYVDALFPSVQHTTAENEAHLPDINPSFLTERSQSLWSQLVAPPPLQPPNWVRSRIRRLFLVSLGVPVDLDEILPASKQKKLILPSIDVDGEVSQPREAEEPRLNGAVSKLKQNNPSAASLSSSPPKADRKKRGPAPQPGLDLNSARLLCSTTDAALQNLSDEELQEHVSSLEELKQRAGELLEHWLIRKDNANGDKEAFEEVIENLVKHAKKIRK